ncbi:hypothetical protein WBG83_12960 [Paenibacillus sp. y28]
MPQAFHIIDNSAAMWTGDVLQPFAQEELWCRQVGQGMTPIVHLWRHEKALVVGLRDRRLPQAEAAMAALREEGWAVAVRNSGGAAVPLDSGVLNVSLILPNPAGRMEHHQDFALMAALLGEVLAPYTGAVKAGEIAGSYCPGDYDLSIGGRKFCGIAQRRQIRAFVVQAFIVTEGSGEQRGRTARRFYDQAAQACSSGEDAREGGPQSRTAAASGTGAGSGSGSQVQPLLASGAEKQDGSHPQAGGTVRAATPEKEAALHKEAHYPRVSPQQMASLTELGVPLTAADLSRRIVSFLEQLGGKSQPERQNGGSQELPAAEVQEMVRQLHQRYDRR